MLGSKAHNGNEDMNLYLYEEKPLRRSEQPQLLPKSIHIFKRRNFYNDLKSLTYCRAGPQRREPRMAAR